MNQREKIILVITIVLIFIAIGMKMLPEDFLRGSGGEVAGARGTFEEYLNQVKIGPAIREAYQRVNTQMPERLPNSTPEATFSNEVARRLQEKGWERPTVKPARPAEIKNVDDYYYIDLDLSLEGTLDRVIDVLVDFQRTGLLIKAFQIEKRNMDSGEVGLTVTVSRLAKMDEERLRKLRKKHS